MVQILAKSGLIWGRKGSKLPQNGPFHDAAPPRNNLKFYNLGITNAKKMKLTTFISLHETFHLGVKIGRKRALLKNL